MNKGDLYGGAAHWLVDVGHDLQRGGEMDADNSQSPLIHRKMKYSVLARNSTRRSHARVGGGWCKLKGVLSFRKHVPFTWRSTRMELW